MGAIHTTVGENPAVLENASTTFSPGTDSLNITCVSTVFLNISAISLLHSDVISKKESLVATVYNINKSNNQVLLAQPYTERSGVDILAFVSRPNTSFLTLWIAQASTLYTDGGRYRCILIYEENDVLKNLDKQSGDIIPIVNPPVGPTLSLQSASVSSSSSNTFLLGTILTLKCRGEIWYSPDLKHRWCWRKSFSDKFTLYPSDGGLHQGTPIKQGCQYIRTSMLVYIVQEDDVDTTFLCENDTPYTRICGSKDVVSISNRGVPTQSTNAENVTTPAEPTDADKEKNSQQCIGLLAATAVVMAVFVILVVLLVVIIKRCKQRGSRTLVNQLAAYQNQTSMPIYQTSTEEPSNMAVFNQSQAYEPLANRTNLPVYDYLTASADSTYQEIKN